MTAEGSTPRRWGLFEAPAEPPTGHRLRIDPSWSPRRVSGEIIRVEWRLALAGSLLVFFLHPRISRI
ncbi:MAG: hypothetical protein ACTH31_13050, partial [Pseudoclavibacter sp.]